MHKFLVIITFYSTDSYRVRNLKAVIARCRKVWPDVEICLVEQNMTSDIEGVDYHERYDVEDKFFHKTKLLNHAVNLHPDYTHYVMLDADSWIDSGIVDNIKNNCDKSPLVFPYGTCVYLNEAETRIKCRGAAINLKLKYNANIPITRQTGLVNVFSKEAWDKVGGFDTEFVGWGAEDDAFIFKIRRVMNCMEYRCDSGVVLHLYHKKVNTPTYVEGQNYKKNRSYCSIIRRMSDDEMTQYLNKRISLAELYVKFKETNRLDGWAVVRLNDTSNLKIDTSIYNVKTNEPSLYEVLSEIIYEDGFDYVVSFINGYIKPVKLNNDVQLDLDKFVAEYKLSL